MTRQQRWAKGAFERVSRAKTTSNAGEYKSRCMDTPSLMKQSGLAQAIAFLMGKYSWFVDDLASVLDGTDGKRLRQRALDADLAAYMALTRDVIAVAVWFRRFAQSELGDSP